MVEVLKSRYAGQDGSFDEAKSMQNQFEIAFFTFCNHIDGVLKELTRPIGI